MGELDGGPQDGAGPSVVVHASGERAVDLHRVHGEVAQVGEAGVARAEVVDRQRVALLAQAQQHLDGGVGVGDDRVLGDLEADLGRGDAGLLQRDLDEPGQAVVEELVGREVDEGDLVVAGRAPRRVTEDEPADGHDEPGLLGDLEEDGWRMHDVALVPADQGLGRDRQRRGEVDDRLVVDDELLGLDGATEAGRRGEALDHDRRDLAIEGDRSPGRGALGDVHRGVGVRQEVGCGRGQLGVVHRHADAGGHVEVVAADLERRRERIEDAVGELGGRLGFLDEEHELVAAEAGQADQVGVAGAGRLDPIGHRAQEVVAGGVAEAVVDGLERVEVDEEHGEVPGRRLVDARREQVGEGLAVREARHGVVGGGVLVGLPGSGSFERQREQVRREVEHTALVGAGRADIGCVTFEHRRRGAVAAQHGDRPHRSDAALEEARSLVGVEQVVALDVADDDGLVAVEARADRGATWCDRDGRPVATGRVVAARGDAGQPADEVAAVAPVVAETERDHRFGRRPHGPLRGGEAVVQHADDEVEDLAPGQIGGDRGEDLGLGRDQPVLRWTVPGIAEEEHDAADRRIVEAVLRDGLERQPRALRGAEAEVVGDLRSGEPCGAAEGLGCGSEVVRVEVVEDVRSDGFGDRPAHDARQLLVRPEERRLGVDHGDAAVAIPAPPPADQRRDVGREVLDDAPDLARIAIGPHDRLDAADRDRRLIRFQQGDDGGGLALGRLVGRGDGEALRGAGVDRSGPDLRPTDPGEAGDDVDEGVEDGLAAGCEPAEGVHLDLRDVDHPVRLPVRPVLHRSSSGPTPPPGPARSVSTGAWTLPRSPPGTASCSALMLSPPHRRRRPPWFVHNVLALVAVSAGASTGCGSRGQVSAARSGTWKR